jgi:microcystin-dependent protein
MAQPYIGEIRIFAGNFAPAGWMFCEGQLLPISENDTLFVIIGTQFGGDGQETFALPDLRGRLPIHQGNGFIIAETGGVESVTLSVQQIPVHNHPFLASTNPGTVSNAQGNSVCSSPSINLYIEGQSPDVNLAANVAAPTGGSQPHTNFQPYLCVNYIISLFGLFPNQN